MRESEAESKKTNAVKFTKEYKTLLNNDLLALCLIKAAQTKCNFITEDTVGNIKKELGGDK